MVRSACFIVAIVFAIRVDNASAQTNGDARSNAQSMTGVVKTVTALSLTLEHGGHDIAFRVDASTRVIGRGTWSDLLLRERPKGRSVSDLLHAGDQVTVRYRVSGSAMNALEVRVLKTAPK
jgi:hypothetical protein